MVYVGTYTGPKSKGIYLLRMDPATGKLSEPELAGEVANPSFITISPNHKFLYAAGEVDNFNGKKAGAVSAFSIDPSSGKLTLLNQQTSGGQGPCYVALDATGRAALVANYSGGSVESLPVGEDGRLGEPATFIQHTGKGPDPRRQEAPHAHCFDPAPGNRFALACDLGLDKVMVYRLDPATAKLTPNDPPSASVPAGAGPRHVAFHPTGRFVYVINEMGSSVTHFNYDGDKGVLHPLQTVSTLPAGLKVANNTCAEVLVHPSGKFLYGSNRGHDSIAIFRIDEQTGAPDPRRPPEHRRQNPPQLRHRPDRHLADRGEPGLRQRWSCSRSTRTRGADAERRQGERPVGGVREVSDGGEVTFVVRALARIFLQERDSG